MPTKASKNVAAAGEIGPNGQKQPSPAEAYLFFTIIKNMRTKPDIDWQGVANDNNFKNAETAKVRYGQIKRKLGFSDSSGPPRGDTNNASDGNGPSTPSSKKGGITPSSGGAATASGGVKKAPRARKPSAAKQAKTDAIVKGRYKSQATIAPAEDEEDDEERVTYCVEHNDDDEDVEMANTPTRKPTKASIKREMGASYSSSSFAAPKKEDDKVQLMSIAPAAGGEPSFNNYIVHPAYLAHQQQQQQQQHSQATHGHSVVLDCDVVVDNEDEDQEYSENDAATSQLAQEAAYQAASSLSRSPAPGVPSPHPLSTSSTTSTTTAITATTVPLLSAAGSFEQMMARGFEAMDRDYQHNNNDDCINMSHIPVYQGQHHHRRNVGGPVVGLAGYEDDDVVPAATATATAVGSSSSIFGGGGDNSGDQWVV